MKFETQLKRIEVSGIRSFDTLTHFFFFAKNEGKSVRELTGDDNNEYQRKLRYFKLLSTGTTNEAGAKLFTTVAATRTRVKKGRYPNVQAIQLTAKGQNLLNILKPKVTKSISKVSAVKSTAEKAKAKAPVKKTAAVKAKAPVKKTAAVKKSAAVATKKTTARKTVVKVAAKKPVAKKTATQKPVVSRGLMNGASQPVAATA